MDSVFLLLILKMITYLDLIIPLVIYISILLVMGRWIRDNELTVISACGIGLGQFVRPIVILFIIIGGVVGAFSLYISPLSAEISANIEFKYRNRTDATGIIPGVFTETRGGTGVYFVERYDPDTDTFKDIFVYNAGEDQDSVVVAESGYKTVDEKTNDDFLVLIDGIQYRGNAGEERYTVVDFESYAIRLKARARTEVYLPVKARPTMELFTQSGHHQAAIGEFHWRISKVIMLPILMLMALCFSSITYRKKRFPGIITALIAYFAYSNILGLVVALIRKEAVHPHLSLWLVHFAFFGLAIYMFNRRKQNLPLVPGFST